MQKRKSQETRGKSKNNRKVISITIESLVLGFIVRLVRSSSINRLPPLNPSFDPSSSSQDAYRSRANSTTSYHEGAFSSFRSRNLSSASSTGPISPLHMDDLASHSFPLLTDSLKGESDLDSITLDELKLESDQMSSLDPANMLFDFLHPEKRELQNLNPVPHKIKVSKQQTINELF